MTEAQSLAVFAETIACALCEFWGESVYATGGDGLFGWQRRLEEAEFVARKVRAAAAPSDKEPELLAALRDLLGQCLARDNYRGSTREQMLEINRARAAIAKVTGSPS